MGIRPNDIMLTASDRAISRTHCKIITEHGFKVGCTEELLAFLMAKHKRLGRNSAAKVLPQQIFRLIYDYFKPAKVFYLVDLGSVYGTYVKVSKHLC